MSISDFSSNLRNFVNAQESNRASEAAPAPAKTGQEPIYQRQEVNGAWRDTTLLGYEAWRGNGGAVRVVYGSPVAARELDADAERQAVEFDDLTTYPSPHGTLVRLADVKCRVWGARATAESAPAGCKFCLGIGRCTMCLFEGSAESAPRTFEQWWAEPTLTTAAPYTFMDESSARAAWVAARNAAETAPASAAPREQPKKLAHGHRDDFYLMANARIVAEKPIHAIRSMPNWVFAGQLFATGSTSAWQICIDAGIDPDGYKVERAPSNSPVGAKEQNK